MTNTSFLILTRAASDLEKQANYASERVEGLRKQLTDALNEAASAKIQLADVRLTLSALAEAVPRDQ